MPITKENVKKIPKHRYFDTTCSDINEATKNKELNAEYNECIMRNLLLAYKNNNTEALILMNNNTYQKWPNCNQDNINVYLSDAMVNELSRMDNCDTFTAFHNHTTDNSFSIKDIITFLDYGKMDTLVLVTNSCKYIAIMRKPYNIGNTGKILLSCMKKIIEFMIKKQVITGHESAVPLFPVLEHCNFWYKVYTNY